MMKVYIGYDERECDAFRIAQFSLQSRSSIPLNVVPLNSQRLAENGLLRRLTDKRGQHYDMLSNAPVSTDFAISRFLVPMLAQTGWALFVDADMLFLGDIKELLDIADSSYAVMVVKHRHDGSEGTKMDGQVQTQYPRKNWSSVVLWNCDHPANKRLSLVDVQERRGFDLHQFYWLHDSEIGELPREWNWLVRVQPKPDVPKIAHYTLGVPSMPGLENSEHAELWWDEFKKWQST